MSPGGDRSGGRAGATGAHEPERGGGTPRFSILIPLEFTRGIADRCVGAWTEGMDYARDRYELILAAPAEHDFAATDLLGGNDRLVELDHDHDIDLVAAAASLAHGEILIFTEAHCVPDPAFLESCDSAFADHPDWDGFSGRSIPLTHNLLSQIEAEMYAADIESNLQRHAWLKVLDQCFVVRRAAYESCGGIEPRFGHFAEHLLAARLHRDGAVIGHDPRPAVEHYYVGEIEDLVEFAHDFGRGELAFNAISDRDPCGHLFEPREQWRHRHGRDRRAARAVASMLLRDLPRALRRARLDTPRLEPQSQPIWGRRARWIGRSLSPSLAAPVIRRLRPRVRELQLRQLQLRFWLLLRHRRRSRAAFLRLNDAAAALGANELADRMRSTEDRTWETSGDANRSEWTPNAAGLTASIGFHELERAERRSFRWSTPEVLIALPPSADRSLVRIDWGPPTGQGHELARFYIDGRYVRARHGPSSTEIEIDPSHEPVRLGWVAGRRRGWRDPRPLGLPVERIEWGALPAAETEGAPPAVGGTGDLGADWRRPLSAAQPGSPTYLLHVTKCGGTSLRLMLGNGFRAAETIGTGPTLYYARNLADHPEIASPDFAFAVGHFGWGLPAAVPERDWRVITMLREPFDRFQSLLGYLRQLSSERDAIDLEEWIRTEIEYTDCLGAFFTARGMNSSIRGLGLVAAALEDGEAEATAALDSCETVGTLERIDDSTNLLCSSAGVLPPRRTPHANPTVIPAHESTGPATREQIERALAPEVRLYERAAGRLEQDRDALYDALREPGENRIDAAGARQRLRRRWFDREAGRASAEDRGARLAWLPEDPFHGENLHQYESHGGVSLRWSGPDETTPLHLLIDPERRWRIRIRLHPATPPEHLDRTRLWLNAIELEAASSDDRDGPGLIAGGTTLEALADPAVPPAESEPFSVLELRSPVRQGRGEHRRLGLALTAILLEPVAP